MAKFKTGSWIGFITVSILLGMARQQKTRSDIVDVISLLVKNYPGYQVTNCSSINIVDEQKAYGFAYTVGQNINKVDDIFNKLFGNANCFNSLDYNKRTSEFVYNLIMYVGAGAIKNNKLEKEGILKSINDLREDFKNNGFDTTQWVQDPETYINIIIEKMK